MMMVLSLVPCFQSQIPLVIGQDSWYPVCIPLLQRALKGVAAGADEDVEGDDEEDLDYDDDDFDDEGKLSWRVCFSVDHGSAVNALAVWLTPCQRCERRLGRTKFGVSFCFPLVSFRCG